jgi:uncharacterized protein with PhoU and TrkA domain
MVNKYRIEIEEEITVIHIMEEATIDSESLGEIRLSLNKIKDYQKKPLLVFANIGTNTSNEANEILMREGQMAGEQIVAVVVKNLASRINANYFKHISKTNKRVEIFSSESEAREWINKMRRL